MPMSDNLKVFVGYDSREDDAYEVCAASIRRHASGPVEIIPIKQADMRDQGLYWRDVDPLASTEFTYTRFLVPKLAGFQGWALFCDCDFLWTSDICEIQQYRQSDLALSCVKHDHQPAEAVKMDGQVQTTYPRKNWSSLMFLNCGHESTRGLTPEIVNSQSGAYLHRMQWASDEQIGELPDEWNWLEGHSAMREDGSVPKAIHFTRGGPWFENYQDVAYAELWINELAMLKRNQR